MPVPCVGYLSSFNFFLLNLNNFFADYDDMPVPCVGYLSSFKISYKNLNTFSRTTTYARTLCRIS
jgi:hypothetical protein